MNSLRVPVTLLVIIVVGFLAWFWLARPAPVVKTTTITATTTASIVQPTPSTPSTPSATANPSSVSADIVGTWRSTDDPNYSIVVTQDGKWTDSYADTDATDSVTETGTYTLFTSADPDKDFTDTVVPGVVYLKVTEGKDTLYYSVLEASGTNLQLSYLDRGNTLSFVKAQ